MPERLKLPLAQTAATERLGALLAAVLLPLPPGGLTVWLQGELGAGKTTLARACLRGLGHAGRVPSPTYTLVETYELAAATVHHVDLYRLGRPEEAAQLGLAELPGPAGLLLVEWPERGRGHLPPADLGVVINLADPGRLVALTGHSVAGRAVLARLAEKVNSGPL